MTDAENKAKAQMEWEERRKARKERQKAAREAKVKRNEQPPEERAKQQQAKGRGIRPFTEEEAADMKERFSDATNKRRKAKRARGTRRPANRRNS